MGSTTAEAPLFEAVITPHRSLGPRGFRFLMLALAACAAAAGLRFYLLGAWPVAGFLGLDLLLLWLAFRLNYRHARQYERLLLTREALTVERLGSHGERRAWRFQPAWLRVELEHPREPDSPLYLASHGRRLAIAACLSIEEKVELAAALDAGLVRARGAG